MWAQPETLWTKTFGGSQYDRGNSVSVVNTDGVHTGYINRRIYKNLLVVEIMIFGLLKLILNGNIFMAKILLVDQALMLDML